MAKPHYIRGWHWILQPGDEWVVAGLLATVLGALLAYWLAFHFVLNSTRHRRVNPLDSLTLSAYATLIGVASTLMPYGAVLLIFQAVVVCVRATFGLELKDRLIPPLVWSILLIDLLSLVALGALSDFYRRP